VNDLGTGRHGARRPAAGPPSAPKLQKQCAGLHGAVSHPQQEQAPATSIRALGNPHTNLGRFPRGCTRRPSFQGPANPHNPPRNPSSLLVLDPDCHQGPEDKGRKGSVPRPTTRAQSSSAPLQPRPLPSMTTPTPSRPARGAPTRPTGPSGGSRDSPTSQNGTYVNGPSRSRTEKKMK